MNIKKIVFNIVFCVLISQSFVSAGFFSRFRRKKEAEPSSQPTQIVATQPADTNSLVEGANLATTDEQEASTAAASLDVDDINIPSDSAVITQPEAKTAEVSTTSQGPTSKSAENPASSCALPSDVALTTAVLTDPTSVDTLLVDSRVIPAPAVSDLYDAAAPAIVDGAKRVYSTAAPVIVDGAKKAYHAVSEIDYEKGLSGIRRTYDRIDFLVEKAIAAIPDPRDIDIKIIMRSAARIKKSLESAIDSMTPDNAQEVLAFAGKAFKGFSDVILDIIKP